MTNSMNLFFHTDVVYLHMTKTKIKLKENIVQKHVSQCELVASRKTTNCNM